MSRNIQIYIDNSIFSQIFIEKIFQDFSRNQIYLEKIRKYQIILDFLFKIYLDLLRIKNSIISVRILKFLFFYIFPHISKYFQHINNEGIRKKIINFFGKKIKINFKYLKIIFSKRKNIFLCFLKFNHSIIKYI